MKSKYKNVMNKEKITILDLINLIGKKERLPKKIKVDNSILSLEELRYKFSNNGWLCFDYYIENAKLDYEIEIIEW